MSFPSSRAAALAQLQAFLPRAGRAYAATRNQDSGPGERRNVSMLSPAIRRRLVSEEEVAQTAFRLHGINTAEKFIMEVCWRSYWRGWLEARPTVWQRYLADVDRLETRLVNDRGLAVGHAEAVAGTTGIDCFDFWVEELKTTGYLHNHARMSFASIWIFTLRLPWQLGAAFFFRHLLDACPASNTLGWRWVAGLQTAGKTYLASADTIRRTSGGRFSVQVPLATHAAPEPQEAPVHPAGLRPLPAADPDARAGLWLHTEDLSPETMIFPASIAAIAAVNGIGGDPAGPKRAYANASLEDAVERACGHFKAPVARLAEASLEAGLPDWAEAEGLRQILTPYAATGPVADRLALVAKALAGRDIRLVPLRRSWDTQAWPHATRGFFQFKAKIPSLLQPDLFQQGRIA